MTSVPSHTVGWTDGLTVVRVMTIKRQTIVLLRWEGRDTYIRLGPNVAQITDSRRTDKQRLGT